MSVNETLRFSTITDLFQNQTLEHAWLLLNLGLSIYCLFHSLIQIAHQCIYFRYKCLGQQ